MTSETEVTHRVRERARHLSDREKKRGARLRNLQRLPADVLLDAPDPDVAVHLGWGRLIFAQTFDSMAPIVDLLREEAVDERDIAVYVTDPHVALAAAPQEVFLDPSHTFRLWLSHYRPGRRRPVGFFVRRLRNRSDAEALNRIYANLGMVTVPVDFLLNHRHSRRLIHLVAEEEGTGRVVGTVTGVDHYRAFGDPEQGASLWCLAADPQSSQPGIGEALVRYLAEYYHARGRAFLDLSVMHDNAPAIRLYEKLGFTRIPLFCMKHKSPFNEQLFTAPQPAARLNPYARIIVNEARRRGIRVEVEDPDAGLFHLSFGGRTIACRESLSDLTSAVALSRCDDKRLTHRLLARAGLEVPDQMEAGDPDDNAAFLARQGSVVVKPARGEQGAGISVNITHPADLKRAVERAERVCDTVILERYVAGDDVRIIVIGDEVVAAAVRRPAAVVGNGHATVTELIQMQSRRRAAATGGESRIPLDGETERCVHNAGYHMEDVLPEGQELMVRSTANLHTGGTIHDVTADLHPGLADAAVRAADALQMPVVGLDFLVPAVDGPEYVIIEANERPGLANHEPQPTAERFIDLLFPQTQTKVRTG
jgi:GNAT-family acetyltransferase (TIGR03103 family)